MAAATITLKIITGEYCLMSAPLPVFVGAPREFVAPWQCFIKG